MQEKLYDHQHYYHTHSDFFKSPSDLVHAFLMPNYNIGMHEQEFYEINIVTSGEGMHYIDGHRVDASPGDVFIVPPNISHGYVGGKGFDVYHVIFNDTFMQKHLIDLQQLPNFFTLFGAEPLMRGKTASPLHLKLSNNEMMEVVSFLDKISKYNDFENTTQGMIRSNLAMVSIGLLCNAYESISDDDETLFRENRALMESISYIHEKYYEKITIEDLAHIAHTSRSSYIMKFKEICKMPPASYITKVRIEAAASMLTNTNLTISEIADRTGFYDTAHFSKVFKDTYGVAPIQYRSKDTI